MFSKTIDILVYHGGARMNRYQWQWHEDSLNVVMLLALSQGPNKLRRFARQHGAFEETAIPDAWRLSRRQRRFVRQHGVFGSCEEGPKRNMGEVLQRLAEITREGGEVANEIRRDLDARFRSTLLKVRSLDAEEVKKLEMKWPVPLMWAAIRDDREEVQSHGRYLAHALIWRALREAFVGEEPGNGSEEAVKSLQEQNRAQAAELENLRRELEKNKVEVEGVKRALRLTEPRYSSQEREKIGQGRVEREIKKLGHELNREREKVKELTQRLSGSNGCRAPVARAPTVDVESAGSLLPEECSCAEDAGSSACGELCLDDGVLCGECPLGGLRVAVVGGLQRMLPAYRRIVSQLGAEFLFHDGKVANGSDRLRHVVCGADIVVFITSVNSHAAMDVVKAVCKKNGKKFIAPKETGSETLGRLLRACCA